MSTWADHAIRRLQDGQSATITPRGQSMRPKVLSGQTVELEPVGEDSVLERGDVVLVKVCGRIYLHLISGLEGDRVQIANNRGRVNGWTQRRNVYGRAIRITGR